jgi:hypothetical protein
MRNCLIQRGPRVGHDAAMLGRSHRQVNAAWG